MARLLHERIASVVERDRVNDARVRGLGHEALGFRRGHRQRLVRDDVLALRDRRRRDRRVQIIRRRVVHHLDGRIVEQRLIAPVGLVDVQRRGLAPGGGLVAAGDGDDVDEAEAPDRVDVMRSHEAGADDPHANAFHKVTTIHRHNPV